MQEMKEFLKSEKELKWEKIKDEINKTTDKLGEKVDDEIKEAVVALNALGLPTVGSCEGHINHGFHTPWIDMAAPNKPVEEFINEKKIMEETAARYGIPVEDIRKKENLNAWKEANQWFLKSGKTPEYKGWEKENERLKEKIGDLLEEFYKNRPIPDNIRLNISEFASRGFRIYHGEKNDKPIVKRELSEKDKSELEKQLIQRQQEMKIFTRFLRDKYFLEK